MKKTVVIALIAATIFSSAHALFIDVQNNSPFKIEISFENPQGGKESRTFDEKDTKGSINLSYCPAQITLKALTGKYVGKEPSSFTPVNCKRFILLIAKGEKSKGLEITQKE